MLFILTIGFKQRLLSVKCFLCWLLVLNSDFSVWSVFVYWLLILNRDFSGGEVLFILTIGFKQTSQCEVFFMLTIGFKQRLLSVKCFCILTIGFKQRLLSVKCFCILTIGFKQRLLRVKCCWYWLLVLSRDFSVWSVFYIDYWF